MTYNTKYSDFDTAASKHDGLAVIGVFFQVCFAIVLFNSRNEENLFWTELCFSNNIELSRVSCQLNSFKFNSLLTTLMLIRDSFGLFKWYKGKLMVLFPI